MLVIGDDEMATCSSKATSSIFYLLFSVFYFHQFPVDGSCVRSQSVDRVEGGEKAFQIPASAWHCELDDHDHDHGEGRFLLMIKEVVTMMAMLGNWEADKAQLACCGSVKRKLP